MNTTLKVMTYDEWVKEFNPVRTEGGDVRLYETYGTDMDTLVTLLARQVWTIMDGPGRYTYVVNGAHWVNRLAYHVTEKMWDEGVEYEVREFEWD